MNNSIRVTSAVCLYGYETQQKSGTESCIRKTYKERIGI